MPHVRYIIVCVTDFGEVAVGVMVVLVSSLGKAHVDFSSPKVLTNSSNAINLFIF